MLRKVYQLCPQQTFQFLMWPLYKINCQMLVYMDRVFCFHHKKMTRKHDMKDNIYQEKSLKLHQHVLQSKRVNSLKLFAQRSVLRLRVHFLFVGGSEKNFNPSRRTLHVYLFCGLSTNTKKANANA